MHFGDKKLLLFDLDGTLINSAPDLANGVNAMLDILGRERFDVNTIHGWVGNGALMLVRRALSGDVNPSDELDDGYVTNALEIFMECYSKTLCVDTQIYTNVDTTIRALKNKGYKLCIITNKPYRFVAPILDGLGLDGIFEFILGGDSLEYKKPNPISLIYACKHFGVDIKDALMIGDSKNDIEAANNCSMDSVGVTYGYNYGVSIDIFGPTVIIDDFEKLLELL
ncbi:MAG: phosphoglycolate phosphatase [Epsilonproteobacteria bacterium]|nr:phosphoglycolate phosphatase [Campylobacterota bacterium]